MEKNQHNVVQCLNKFKTEKLQHKFSNNNTHFCEALDATRYERGETGRTKEETKRPQKNLDVARLSKYPCAAR